jgi:hypothetical protein
MNNQESQYEYESKKNPANHYYGSLVRKLFVFAVILQLIIILIDRDLIQFNLVVGVISVLVIVVLAGFTSPANKWAMIGDLVFAAVSFIIFEYLAIARQLQVDTFFDSIFLMRQVLAIIFVIAVYFSTKTVRGLIIKM